MKTEMPDVEPCAPEHFVLASGGNRLAQARCGQCQHVLAVHAGDRICDLCVLVAQMWESG